MVQAQIVLMDESKKCLERIKDKWNNDDEVFDHAKARAREMRKKGNEGAIRISIDIKNGGSNKGKNIRRR